MLAVREQITSHPETHDQGDWALKRPGCGTTLCIAGWACQLSGEQLRWFEDETEEGDPLRRANYTRSGGSIWDRAGELLGLSLPEAGRLFHNMDNADALARLDELIEKGKNQP